MSDSIIVKNLSKIYNISHEKTRYKSLRDDIVGFAKHPFSAFSEKKEKFYALKNVSFSVKQGETLGIIGPNGAGKSTLLKILSRITPPTSGEVILNGRVSSLLEVGTGFHPELTGRENIFLSGAVLGMKQKEIKRKFDEIVDFAGVEQFLDTPVKHFSSGMYTRLAFSVAAHLEPDILIVDEVLAVGDAAFQKKCLGKMNAIGKSGKTIIFVSHNMTAIKSLCRSAIFLKDGEIELFGITSKVISKYSGSLGNKSAYSKVWSSITAPKNSNMILQKIELVESKEHKLREITTDDDFFVKLILKITKKNSYAGLSILLYDSEGNHIFTSLNNHEKNWYGKSMNKGLYTSICKIPGMLLNNGLYSISVYFYDKNFTDDLMVRDVLRFEVKDGLSVRGNYFGALGGILRPQLEWKTTKIM